MSVTLKTHKMLWGRAANRCAFPECRLELVMDASETDDEALIGEECHIIAQDIKGPRGDHALPVEARDKYSNLILLCSNHHTLIDKQPDTYTIDYLQELKANHEKWVRTSLQEFDFIKQREDERYADYIEVWVKRVDLDNWKDWLGWLFYSDPPQIRKVHLDSLIELNFWLASRIWPRRYLELEAAFENFRRILIDIIRVFNYHAFVVDPSEEGENIKIRTEKFYRHHDGPENHDWLQRYLLYLDFLQDLGLELTRSANYICDKVRQFIDPTFRLREGLAMLGGWSEPIRTEYQNDERILYPYPGLEQFKEDRKHRDKSYYQDQHKEYEHFLKQYKQS
jgi:hypothetical protein